MANYTFQQYLRDQINEKADGVQSKFARLLNVSTATIHRLLDSENPTRPELETLERLSKITGTSLVSLVYLAYPDSVETSHSATAQIVADEFDKLPEELQGAVIALMRGIKARG